MTIKDFTVGQTAYMVTRDYNEYRIMEFTVSKVGRRYVTVGQVYGYQFYVPDIEYEDCLHEKEPYGYTRKLFRTRQEAEDYLEKRNLWKELRRVFDSSSVGKYTLSQLRAIKRIIDVGELT